MGDTRPRVEADESPRNAKSPRLDLLALAASAAAPEATEMWEEWPKVIDPWEECPEVTSDNNRCSHVPTDTAHKEILSSSLLSDGAGVCEDCRREEESGKCWSEKSSIFVCLECGRQICAGVWASYLPYGHAREHATQERHWVAVLFDDPESGFCFKCETNVAVSREEVEMMGEIQAGSHAFGFDVVPDLMRGLPNLRDTWYGHALGSANGGQGCAIRGIPNRENTCYVNAMVQCLLMLDKLQARMLGPDALLGHLGLALKELFVEISAPDAVGAMLDTKKLLRSVRLHAGKYIAYKMHDSYELLESLRNALNNEENEIETPNRQRGAPTVIDSVFRGELSDTRSCIYCPSSSVFHESFCDLSLALPSKGHPAGSAASPQTSESLKSQPKKAATQLFPANEENNPEKIQTVAKSSDSHLLGSELKDVVVEKTPESLEVAYLAKQGCYTGSCADSRENVSCSKLSQGIIEGPLKSASFVPHNMSDVKVEPMIETTTDCHSPEDIGPPPCVAPLSDNNARMASVSDVDQTDNADPVDLLNQPEVSIEAKDNTYMVQFTAEDKGNARNGDTVYDKEVGGSNSLPSIEGCLSLFFAEQVVERHCDDCSKVPEEPGTNQSENGEQMVTSTNANTAIDGDQTEQPDRTCQNEQSSEPNSLPEECKSSSSRQPHNSDAESEIVQTVGTNTEGTNSGMSFGEKNFAACSATCKEPECHEGIQDAVSNCHPAKKQTNLLSAQHNQNLSAPNQYMRKRLGLDLSVNQLRDNRNEQKDRSGCAIQTPRITKLPSVLTLHLKRYIKVDNLQHHKNEAHVSYKEYLDVRRFVDPSSVDKDNSIYRLVGVIEHRGTCSLNAGHYVAYVRARRLGNHQQQSSCSSSWFCADDSNITEVTLAEVLKREAYILFYERMEG